MGTAERSAILENVIVGVFGAFIGGEFMVAMFNGKVPVDTAFHFSSLAIAIATAVVMLALLQLMRRAVGPLRSGKAKPRRS